MNDLISKNEEVIKPKKVNFTEVDDSFEKNLLEMKMQRKSTEDQVEYSKHDTFTQEPVEINEEKKLRSINPF